MAERSCAHCGGDIRTTDRRARFCGPTCKSAAHKARVKAAAAGAKPDGEPTKPPSDKVQGPLGRELIELGVADTYEGAVALGLAAQLDGGTVMGTAYVSLSKELDRRVEELRRRAPAKDDATSATRDAVAEKRLRLA